MLNAHEFSQMIGLFVIVYLVGLLIIAGRLRSAHEAVWANLGNPSVLNWSISNSFRLAAFVFFRNSFRQLADPMLGKLVWAERALLLALIGMTIFWKVHYG